MNKIEILQKEASVMSIIFLTALVFVPCSYAGTYWVSTTGTALWSSCSGATPLNGTNACTLSVANANASAGDTVYLRAGTYFIGSSAATGDGHDSDNPSPGIIPYNSGKSGSPITYEPYSNEVVNLTGLAGNGSTSSIGIWIYSASHTQQYIKVNGKSLGQLVLTKMYVNLLMGPSSGTTASYYTQYNEISYVKAYDSGAPTYKSDWHGNLLGRGVWYNHVHHNQFYRHGSSNTEGDGTCSNMMSGDYNCGNTISLGGKMDVVSDLESTQYNVFENNEIYAGGHAAFQMFGSYNYVRNNYFHNEAWWPVGSPLYGYRVAEVAGKDPYAGHNIFEGNRIGHGAASGAHETYNMGGVGFKLGSPYNTVRYNTLFNNGYGGISFNVTIPGTSPTHNYVYNNTIFKNGFGPTGKWNDNSTRAGIHFTNNVDANYTGVSYNVVKNNLCSDNWGSGNSLPCVYIALPKTVAALVSTGKCILTPNFDDLTASPSDPLFLSENVDSSTSWTLPNMSLQASSPAINAGSHLTQASGGGTNSTTLVVDDTKYFQDAKFGLSSLTMPSSAIVNADWISIGTVINTVQISSINYATNTITLASPMTWANGAYIWLEKISDGAQVLYGTAPDMGAHEYNRPTLARPNTAARDRYMDGSYWELYAGKIVTYRLTSKNYYGGLIKKITQDDVILTKQASLELCESTPGSYFINSSDGSLYVHSNDNADPDIHVIDVLIY